MSPQPPDEPQDADQGTAAAGDREERIRRRLERRREQRRGLRRLRPGLTRGVPWQLAAPSERSQEEALDHEVLSIANAVEEAGQIDLEELRRIVGAKYWGPGRFRPAVREAVADGYVVRIGRNRLGRPPVSPEP